MKLTLSPPPRQYSPEDQAQMRRDLSRQLEGALMKDQDCEIGRGRVILTSEDGSRFVLTVANDGTLSGVAL